MRDLVPQDERRLFRRPLRGPRDGQDHGVAAEARAATRSSGSGTHDDGEPSQKLRRPVRAHSVPDEAFYVACCVARAVLDREAGLYRFRREVAPRRRGSARRLLLAGFRARFAFRARGRGSRRVERRADLRARFVLVLRARGRGSWRRARLARFFDRFFMGSCPQGWASPPARTTFRTAMKESSAKHSRTGVRS